MTMTESNQPSAEPAAKNHHPAPLPCSPTSAARTMTTSTTAPRGLTTSPWAHRLAAMLGGGVLDGIGEDK